MSFSPAMSAQAKKAKGKQIRDWHLNRRSGSDLSGLAWAINAQVRGWINYYGACVPRMRKEVTACERRDRQSNAVQEMEEGADVLLPGPPGSALRERDSKPLQGASVKSGGLERCRKRQGNPCQVSTTELSESEPSDDASKSRTMTSEPGLRLFPGISLAGSTRSWPGGVRRKGGKNVVWALVWNSGTSRVVASPEIGGNGSTPRPKAEGESTGCDALGRTAA